MSDYPKLAARAADQYLAALAARQESFLKYVAAARALAVPRPPALPLATTAIETSQWLNEAQFDFASRLLERQKQFFDALFSQPARTGTLIAKRSPTKEKSKPSSNKSSAKKVSAKQAPTKRKSAKKPASKAAAVAKSDGRESASS